MEVFIPAQRGFGHQDQQYGRSPHDYQDPTGHSNPDRSSNSSTSFDLLTDLSPSSAQMEFNLSEGASSDHSYVLNPFDIESAAQMSNDFGVHPGFFEQDYMVQTSQAFQGSSAPFAQQSLTTASESFGQASHLGPSPRFGHLTHQTQGGSFECGYISNPPWIDTGHHHSRPTLKVEHISEDELISPASFSTQESQEPWSPAGQPRFAGQALPHHNGWGPSADTLDPASRSYAPSVISHSSSPHIEGIATPDSSRSPMFSNANLYGSSVGSSGGDSSRHGQYQEFQQTPRAAQMGFQTAQYNDHHHVLAGMTAPPQLLIDPSGQQLYREPTYSPASEYVMVDYTDVPSVATNKQVKTVKSPTQKTTKKVPCSKSRQDTNIFIPEGYPPSTADNSRRRYNDQVFKRSRDAKRVGGRSLGMHLDPVAAARAKQLRDEGSCWICCLQRDSCTPGEICDRCEKRSQRAQLEHGLGCDRTKLTELRPFFIPDFLARSGDKSLLNNFMDKNIRRWTRRSIKLRINVVWGQKPIILELYEFEPKTLELVRHFHGVYDDKTGKRNWVKKNSPPLAMVTLENADRQAYERYINNIVDTPADLHKFVERCFRSEKDNFQSRLLQLMADYEPGSTDERLLLREIFRLQIITYIYARVSTIMNGDLHLLATLHYTAANRVEYQRATSARLANRQLKYLYTSLWTQIMEGVLKRLQQVLRSSRGGAKWSSAFCAVIGLGMAFEAIQNTAHAHQEADELMGNSTEREATARAENACRVIDEKFGFLADLFRWKYHRGFNPFKSIHDGKVQSTLGSQALQLVQGVYELVQEKYEFLLNRDRVPILKGNQDKYTSRLVARFLLAFYGPTS